MSAETPHAWRRPVLWLALLTHAVLATAYLTHTPAFEGPDENDHAYYVAHLLHTGSLPRISDNPPMTGGMLAHHPPLYYALLAALAHVAGSGDYTPCWRPNPAFPARSPVKWLHGHDELPPRSDEIGVLRVLRAFSVLCGLATIALTHRLGLALFPAWPRVADVAALGLACIPQWSWLHGCLDNGNLAAALATAALLLMVRAVQRGTASWRGGVAAGAVTGLALVTKLTAIFLLPLLLLAGALLGKRAPRPRALAWTAAALLAALAVAGWSFARNLALYGDPLGLSAHALAFADSRVPEGALARYLLTQLPLQTLGSALAAFGWAGVRLPAVLELLAAALALCALLGWARRWRVLRAAAGAALWLPALAVALVAASVVRYNLTYVQPQGRYLFPAYGAAAVLLAAGLVVPWQRGALAGRLRPVLLAAPPLAAVLVFACAFRPLLAAGATAPSPFYASLIEGLASPPPAARATIRALAPDDGALLEAAPTFRWDDSGYAPGMRYSVHLVVATGVPIATHESAGIEISAQEWTMPAHFWESLRGLGPFWWKVRRLPDRARGEGVDDVPATAPRVLRGPR